LVILAAVVCSSSSAFGQGTDLGTVRGTVTDTGGAVIADAAVVITDDLTKAIRETRTNSQGDYELVGLNAGTYTVTITCPGMSKSEITNVAVNGSDSVGVDAVLKISSAQGKRGCFDAISGHRYRRSNNQPNDRQSDGH
jgi:hypothetical protein